jgi:hypothetical protein
MADMVPIAVDRLTGAGRPVVDGDVITTPDGTVLTGGVPTAATWGVNVETLAGNKTLTDSSEVVHFLDPGGTDRFVDLPPLTSSTPFFTIIHDGTADTILIRTDGGDSVAALSITTGVQLYNDGSSEWKSTDFTFTPTIAKGLPLWFQGAETGSPTGSWEFGVNIDITDTTINNPEASTIALAAMSITRLYRDTTNTGNVDYQIYVNGSLQGTISAPDSGSVIQEVIPLATPIPIAVGDVINVAASAIRGATRIGLLGAGPSGYTISFGGTHGTTFLAEVQCDAEAINVNTTASDPRCEATVVGAVTASVIGIVSSQSTASRSVEIYKNNVLSETVVISGITLRFSGVYAGHAAASTVFADGDHLSVREITTGSSKHINVYLTGSGQQCLGCGGQMSSTNYFAEWNRFPSWTGLTTAVAKENQIQVQHPSIPTIGYRQTSAPTQDHRIYKNGIQSETANMQATSGTVSLTTVYLEGDLLAIQNPPGGTLPSISNYQVVF